MLPRKRLVQGVAVEENNNNSESSLKKNRIGCLIAETDGSNNDSTCAVAEDSSNSSSVVVEPSLSNMALGDSSQYIDEDLHSRQLAVYGRETMRRLFSSSVLVSGMQGLGAEVAKNLILAGVKSVTLHDEGAVDLWDLSSNFIFSESDVGKNRALASAQKLQELNNAVLVSSLTTKLTKE